MKSLQQITISKSLVLSIGLHALLVAGTSLFFLSSSKESLELTGLKGGGGPRRLISLSSLNISAGAKSFTASGKKLAVTQKLERPDPFSKTIAKSKASENKEVIRDTVNETASAVSANGPVGDGVGTSNENASYGLGTGSGDFDGGVLFSQIKRYFETRLGNTLLVNEDQLIKVKLKLNRSGEILSAELVEGKLEMSNLRKVLAVARNVPVKSYWKGQASFPGELILPLFITAND